MVRLCGFVMRWEGFLKGGVHEFFATLADEADDECGPAGLVRGSEAFAGLSVEVFVKEDEVLPVLVIGVAFGDFRVAEAGAVAVFVFLEEGDEAVTDVDGDFPEGEFFPGAGGVLDFEVVSVEVMVALEGFDEDEVGGEPDGASPV